jgi:uncharacterized membrane protein
VPWVSLREPPAGLDASYRPAKLVPDHTEDKISSSAKGHSPVGLYVFLVTYAICLGLLLPKLSLWLDEILDLIGARRQNSWDLINYVRMNPGAVPLGYLAQAAAIRTFGLSAFSGRLPSALSSLASCVGVYFLARRTVVRWPLLGVLAFAICPVQLRYALEARGYALALALSICASLLFCLMLEPSRVISFQVLYGLCVLAGVYTQPFSLFVPMAHLAWLSLVAERVVRRRLLVSVSLIILLSGLLFLPWYVYVSGAWMEGITAYHFHGTITLRSIPRVLRELVGMGYVGTGIVLVGALFAVTSRKMSRSDVLFWVFYAFVPVACVLVVDRTFGYFLAIRQVIFVLPPLSVLIALAAERTGRLGIALGLTLLISAFWNDMELFNRPREDWQSAAGLLKTEADEGACVLFAPADSLELYTFFVPELSKQECTNGNFGGRNRVDLAVSPYEVDKAYLGLERQLGRSGFSKVGELNAIGPRIEIFQRK